MNAVKHPIKRSFVFFLVPDFTMVAFATALDPLRLANCMLGYPAYQWRLASLDGGRYAHRVASNVRSMTSCSRSERRKMAGPDRPSMVVVRAGINVETYQNKSVFAWLREEYNRGRYRRPLHRRLRAGQCGAIVQQALRNPLGEPAGFSKPSRRPMSLPISSRSTRNIYTCAGGTLRRTWMLKPIGDDFDESPSTGSANRC